MRFAEGVRGRRVIGAVATVAAAAAAAGVAVPAMAASGAPAGRDLSGGQVAARSAVPWGKVGPGWSLAKYSADQGGPGVKPRAGASALYLVDPQGARYTLATWPARSPRAQWAVLGWSGDASRALFAAPAGFKGAHEHVYQMQLRTGRVTGFTLPVNVAAVGYTRPDGLNILAEKGAPAAGNTSITLQRYSLTGQLQKSLATFTGYLSSGGIPYSPDGTQLAAGTASGLELISNAGGVIRTVTVPGATGGCTAVRWWNSATILASCMAAHAPGPRMWLVPASGATPAALTPARTAKGFDFGDFNAWQLSSGLYVNGEGACGSVVIGRQPAHGKEQQVTIPDSGSNLIVNATRSTLQVERINGCMPGRSLVVFNPATRKMTIAIPVTHHQFGVTAVVPYYIAGKY